VRELLLRQRGGNLGPDDEEFLDALLPEDLRKIADAVHDSNVEAQLLVIREQQRLRRVRERLLQRRQQLRLQPEDAGPSGSSPSRSPRNLAQGQDPGPPTDVVARATHPPQGPAAAPTVADPPRDRHASLSDDADSSGHATPPPPAGSVSRPRSPLVDELSRRREALMRQLAASPLRDRRTASPSPGPVAVVPSAVPVVIPRSVTAERSQTPEVPEAEAEGLDAVESERVATEAPSGPPVSPPCRGSSPAPQTTEEDSFETALPHAATEPEPTPPPQQDVDYSLVPSTDGQASPKSRTPDPVPAWAREPNTAINHIEPDSPSPSQKGAGAESGPETPPAAVAAEGRDSGTPTREPQMPAERKGRQHTRGHRRSIDLRQPKATRSPPPPPPRPLSAPSPAPRRSAARLKWLRAAESLPHNASPTQVAGLLAQAVEVGMVEVGPIHLNHNFKQYVKSEERRAAAFAMRRAELLAPAVPTGPLRQPYLSSQAAHKQATEEWTTFKMELNAAEAALADTLHTLDDAWAYSASAQAAFLSWPQWAAREQRWAAQGGTGPTLGPP